VIGNAKSVIKKYSTAIVNILASQFIVENGDYRKTVFLAGTGRSGTTWVMNIINYDNRFRILFEPFHSRKIKKLHHFEYRQYLRPENAEESYLAPAKQILSGRIKNIWSDAFNRKIFVEKRLIKDIRANHLLKWIKVNFPEIPIILLLRHPCAVATSKLELNWETHLEVFLNQMNLMEDFLNPFKYEITKAESAFEKHIFMWCIENYVPLSQFKSGEIHLAYYENFCIKPEFEIDRLFRFLEISYTREVHRFIKHPSAFSQKDSAITLGENLIEGWKKHLSAAQVMRAMEILRVFNLERLYSQDPLPLVSDGENPLSR
jgi:hypothetical protein